MTREEFIAEHPLIATLERNGVKLIGNGNKRTAKCPFHEDGSPSFSVDVDKGLWHCHAGCGGGSVIDLIARFEGKNPKDLLKEPSKWAALRPAAPPASPSKPRDPNAPKPTIDKIYPYQNEFGQEVYQAIRLKPKSFRQRHPDGKGGWVWNMDDVDRVLYRLPEVLKAQVVAIAEGEKDAETLTALGYCGTCNVGGAGKWLDGYTNSLKGKDVLIFGDNDKAGQDHVKLVFDSIAGLVKSVRIIKIPSTFKDITEYVESFVDIKEASVVIADLVSQAHPFLQGVAMPLFTMAEIEARYIRYAEGATTESVNLSKWLPSFSGHVRALVPGELVLIVGDTGTGKTGLLQGIALSALPLPTLMFEIELPAELLFERFIAAKTKLRAREVESTYASGDYLGETALNTYFKNLFICDEANLSTEKLEAMILRSELKIGQRPKLVLVDYVQLLKGEGESRYDRASNVAEAMKRIAKTTGTVIVITSQRGRPKDGGDPEVTLHCAKETGSLENSAGLVLGVWRDPEDKGLLHMQVLKNTKGTAGLHIECNFNGENMTITERPRSYRQ